VHPDAAHPADAGDPVVPARVRLLTRDGCHLCDEARTVVAQVCATLGESYEEVDLDTASADDPELRRRYTDEVPVTFVDGVQHAYWRVDPARLRTALARPRA
jgi:glutaredoxin